MADTLPRFGANDFYLTETDPIVLREKLRSALADVLGREVVDSDPHMILASAFMPFLVQGLASIDACAKATLRAYAIGADLDRIADSTCVVGYLNRKPARGAILPALVQCRVTRSDSLAPSDALVTWSASRSVSSVRDVAEFFGSGSFVVHFSLSDGLSKMIAFPVYLRCAVPGPGFNAIFDDVDDVAEDVDLTSGVSIDAEEASSTATAQTFSVDQISASIAGETYGGADLESDEAFAVRVGWQAKAVRVPGSLEYFRLVLSELSLLPSAYISPELDDAGRIVLAWADKPNYVAGKAGISLTYRGAAHAEFLNAIQGALLVEQHAYAYLAGLYSPTATFVVSYKTPAEVADVSAACERVSSAFKAWRSGVAWHCGAAVRASDAIAAIAGAGAVGVSVYAGSVPESPLPADRIMLANQIALVYAGSAVASTPAAGGSGEDITPV